jgi:hypothetical protein
MKGLWKAKYYGWIKDFKRKKNTKINFLKDNYSHDIKNRVETISEKQELEVFELRISVSIDNDFFNILKSIEHENIEKKTIKEFIKVKAVFFEDKFYSIKKNNQIGDILETNIYREFYRKNNCSFSYIKIDIIKKTFLNKQEFNVKKRSNYYGYEKKITQNNENHFKKYKNKESFSKKYAKHRFNKFSRNEGKKICSNYEEDIKFKIPSNILSWIK